MGWLGPGEIILILILALILFGPNKLPELGRIIGEGIREFKKASQVISEEVEGEKIPEDIPPSPDFNESEYSKGTENSNKEEAEKEEGKNSTNS